MRTCHTHEGLLGIDTITGIHRPRIETSVTLCLRTRTPVARANLHHAAQCVRTLRPLWLQASGVWPGPVGPARLMRRALWLACYPDGTWRHRDKGHRARSKLPSDAWFRQRLVALAGAGADRRALRRLGGGFDNVRSPVSPKPLVVGLACIAGGAAACTFEHGPLTAWSDEARAQLAYYNAPSDAYTVHVQAVSSCVQPPSFTNRVWEKQGQQQATAALSLSRPLLFADVEFDRIQLTTDLYDWNWYNSDDVLQDEPLLADVGECASPADRSPSMTGAQSLSVHHV